MFRDYFFNDGDGQPVLDRAKVKADALAYWSNPEAALAQTVQGLCRYRLDKTPECPVKCNVGILIADEEYQPGFEDASLYDVMQALAPGSSERDHDWLRGVQRDHDMSGSREELVERMTALTLAG